ncbi:MAG: universal stress protein [Pseudomonadota bacterium]
MTLQDLKPKKILAVAGPHDTSTAINTALALAERHEAALDVIACVEPPHDVSIVARLSGVPPERLIEESVQRIESEIREKLDQLAPDRDIALCVSVGKSYLEIIHHVARNNCDFVVKKADPLIRMDRFFFASTDQHLLRKCPCPVWLQTHAAQPRPKRIIAAVDLDIADASEPETLQVLNRRVLKAAYHVADEKTAEIVVLHAWDAFGEGMIWAFSNKGGARLSADQYVSALQEARQIEMDRLLNEVRADVGQGITLVPHLMRGPAEKVIHEQCRALDADVVVMGTVARTGISGVFIGNTAENIINNLECSVLAVKPDGFVSPLL